MTRYMNTTPARVNAGSGPFQVAALDELYHQWYNRLLGVTTTRYRWLGLGPWIDPLRLEFLLVTRGLCAFTYVNQRESLPAKLTGARSDYYTGLQTDGLQIQADRFTVTQAVITGTLDDTFTPAGYRTYAPNGAGGIQFNTLDKLSKWRAVPIWGDANRSMYDAYTIAYYAKRLAQAALAVDTDLLNTMRSPIVVTTQDKLKSATMTLENMYAGVPSFTVDGENAAAIKAIDLGVHPDIVENAQKVASMIWAEALEALGIESPLAEKPERRVSDEVDRNGSHVAAIRRLTLVPRRRAAMLINERYFSGEPVVEVVDQC